MGLFNDIGCFIGKFWLAIFIFYVIVVILVMFAAGMGFVALAPVPVQGYTLDVSSSDPAVQKANPNVASAEDCSQLAYKAGAKVAAYIPAMKMCTTFSDVKGLKLTAPADPNMTILSSVMLPMA